MRKPPTKWQEIEVGNNNPGLAANKVLEDVRLSRCTRVSVEGYDTLLPPELVQSALFKHFVGCGEIYAVVIPAIADRCGVIYFWEEGAEEKALALSGTEVPGDSEYDDVEAWNVIVKPLPKKLCDFSLDSVAAALRDMRGSQLGYFNSIIVSGYDTGLPEDDVKSALFKLLSSCGHITYMGIDKDYDSNHLQSRGLIRIWGEGAREKAVALSGSDVGGWNVVVEDLKVLKQSEGAHRQENLVPYIGWSGPPLHERRNVRRWGAFSRGPLPEMPLPTHKQSRL